MEWAAGVWIVVTGVLVGASCGLVGCFLVLRRMAMLGDAISHAVLPGIVVAFLILGERAPLFMLLGAAAMGLVTAFLVQTLERGGVHADASIGITFTALFAIGVVLVSLYTGQVDLDQECVLYGDIAYVGLDQLVVGGRSWGARAAWIVGLSFAVNVTLIGLFFKQFKVCAFDPALAAAVGIPVSFFHYLLMAMVSLTAVSAFESVGAILVVAMLIVPGATAYLLTNRLNWMLIGSVAVGAASALLGYALAGAIDCSIAGAMTVAAGGLFAVSLLAAPEKGIVARWLNRRAVARRIAHEDALLQLYRWAELHGDAPATAAQIQSPQPVPNPAALRSSLRRMARGGLVSESGGGYALTGAGRDQAQTWMRRHRVYESYLDQLGHPPERTHDQAQAHEHFFTPQLTSAMATAAGDPKSDPDGKSIPPSSQSPA
jgi:manganese/zinc/iron transport system permease protein